jgi:hypothetical protein
VFTNEDPVDKSNLIGMKSAFTPATTTLTPENSKSVTKLAALVGWTPDELANHLLVETLETFAHENSGALPGSLGAIYYRDRAHNGHRIALPK